MDTCLKDQAHCPRCGKVLDRILRTLDDQAGTGTLTFVHEDESGHKLSADLDSIVTLFNELTEPVSTASTG